MRPLSLRKRIAFSLILFVLVVAALEGGARFYLGQAKGFDGEHFLQYEFDPYKNILPQRGFVDTRGVVHNDQGFRRQEHVSREKPPGTYRVFLMGASTAYGTGGLWPHLQTEFGVIPDSSTISAYLERKLGAQFPGKRIEVINAAIASTWTHHHLIYLNQTILGFDPDMILFLDGYNDFYHNAPDHEQFAAYAYTEHATTIMGPPTLRALGYANFWWLSRRSALAYTAFRSARALKGLVTGTEPQVPIDPSSATEAAIETFEENALTMIERTALLLEHEGVRAVFMVQPMLLLERGRKMVPIEQELFEFNVESYVPNYEDFLLSAVPQIVALEEEVVRSFGAEFLDLTGIYHDADRQIFTDYTHLTPLGNEILADEVMKAIVPLIQEDGQDPDSGELEVGRG